MDKKFTQHLSEAKAVPNIHKLGQSAASKLTAAKIKFKSYPTSDRHVKLAAMMGNVEVGSLNVSDDGVSEFGSHIGYSFSDPKGIFKIDAFYDQARAFFEKKR